jgi:hypothetical protein
VNVCFGLFAHSNSSRGFSPRFERPVRLRHYVNKMKSRKEGDSMSAADLDAAFNNLMRNKTAEDYEASLSEFLGDCRNFERTPFGQLHFKRIMRKLKKNASVEEWGAVCEAKGVPLLFSL